MIDEIQLTDTPPLSLAGHMPPRVASLLTDAAAAHAQPRRVESILWSAQAMYPQSPPVYFALYKFYFRRGRLADAERATRLALVAAANLAGFAPEWQDLHAHSADWRDTSGPQHFYLFSLKALAFIRLRRGQSSDAAAILRKLAELDARDGVGAEVVLDLVAASGVAHREAAIA